MTALHEDICRCLGCGVEWSRVEVVSPGESDGICLACWVATERSGFHEAIPEAEYHADRDSLSVSGAKTLLKAPAIFRHQQDHPVHKLSLIHI